MERICANCKRAKPVEGEPLGYPRWLKLNLWCPYLDTYTRDDFGCEYFQPKEEGDEPNPRELRRSLR